jgi:hypothetical protein
MNFIKNLIDPHRLLLVWKDSKTDKGKEFVIGEIKKACNGNIVFKYLINPNKCDESTKHNIKPYPAFPDFDKIYQHNVLDTFSMRLPPRKRNDFKQFLISIRIPPETQISDFALLGYSRATLPGDNFSILHPFEQVNEPFEFITEIDFIENNGYTIDDIEIEKEVSFQFEILNGLNSIYVEYNQHKIGYIKQLQTSIFSRIKDANVKGVIEKKSKMRNRVFVFVSSGIRGKKLNPRLASNN